METHLLEEAADARLEVGEGLVVLARILLNNLVNDVEGLEVHREDLLRRGQLAAVFREASDLLLLKACTTEIYLQHERAHVGLSAHTHLVLVAAEDGGRALGRDHAVVRVRERADAVAHRCARSLPQPHNLPGT